jgi:hypothetical protein
VEQFLGRLLEKYLLQSLQFHLAIRIGTGTKGIANQLLHQGSGERTRTDYKEILGLDRKAILHQKLGKLSQSWVVHIGLLSRIYA